MSEDVATDQELAGPPPVLLTKLHPPAVREQTLPREHLLALLRSGAGCRLTVVAAPAGCGKTTLLSAWRAADSADRPMGWLTLDDRDGDPVVLWTHAIEALHGVCPAVGSTLSPALVGSAPIQDLVLPRLVNELAEQNDVCLVLDDFHRLPSGSARDSVAWFVDHAPDTFRLILATRSEPALRLAALRARGDLLELRADDLRFSSEEANGLLNGRLGLGLDREDVDALVERTEGWPAGLYLAALSLRHSDDGHAFVSRFGVSSRHVVDFLVEEVLETHDHAMQALMVRASILERFNGPLCDALLESEGAAAMLDDLSRTNLFLVGLDDRGEWYRFHHLFAQLLRVELDRREPDLAATLHRRAYEWHRAHGTTDEAIQHALEAGAFAEAGDLIAEGWISYANVCRYASVLSWLRRFPNEALRDNVRLRLVEAWVLSLAGRAEEAAPSIAFVEQSGRLDSGPLPDGFASIGSSLTMLRAVFPGGDVGTQLEHALRAAELEAPDSPWRPVACWAVGWGSYFHGRFDDADRWFEESIALAPASEQWLVAGSSLAYRSLIAGEQGRIEAQVELARQAEDLVQEHGIGDVDGEAPLALGVSLAARGRFREALPPIERGVGVLRSWGQPIDLAKALLRQAAVLRAIDESERAAAVIAEARMIIDRCQDPGILSERLTTLDPRARPRTIDGELTARELSVLRLLSGPLSERDIGRELYLSHNTIHSHTRSIYRKLGASSRSEALDRARELGLL